MKFGTKSLMKCMLIVLCLLSISLSSYHDVSAKSKREIVEKAKSRLGCPYVFGACHSLSQVKNKKQRKFDCSGLINWAYYQAGYRIGIHTTRTIKNKGRRVTFNDLQMGDVILYYRKGTKRICHCGLYIGHGKMIHAPCSGSKVKVVALNAYWRGRFAMARRF